MTEQIKVIEQFKGFDSTEEFNAWGFSAETQLRDPRTFFGRGQFPYWTPLSGYEEARHTSLGSYAAADVCSYPLTVGLDQRALGTTSYASVLPEPEDASVKEKKFREWLKPWIEDPAGMWRKYKKELEEAAKPFKETDFEKLSDMELCDFFEFDANRIMRKMWFIHFLCVFGTNSPYILLENLVKGLIGLDDSESLYRDVFAGFDNRIIEADRRMWKLAQRARQLGLEKVFLETPPETLPSKRQESAEMQTWFEEFDAFLDTDGWRNEISMEVMSPPWWEDPTPALKNIVRHLEKSEKFHYDAVRDEIARKRENAVAEVMAKLPTDEARSEFQRYLPAAQMTGVFLEEHTWYCEFLFYAGYYRVVKEIGKRFAESKAIDDWHDVGYLLPQDIISSLARRYHTDLRPIVERRKTYCKARIEAEQKGELPPVLGTPKPLTDSLFAKVVGGGMEKKVVAGADLIGVSGSAGVAEGTARVIMTVDQLKDVKSGEILVTPYTYAPFTPVFGIVKGVVTDTGGTLVHAAIMAREAGIPAVVQTFEGTRRIKTGQRIRVDGTQGAVFFLDK